MSYRQQKAPNGGGALSGNGEGTGQYSDSYFTLTPPPLSSNQFERAAARGSLTPAQERFLIKCDRESLSLARQQTGIAKPIPRLSKKSAWLLINSIVRAQGGRP